MPVFHQCCASVTLVLIVLVVNADGYRQPLRRSASSIRDIRAIIGSDSRNCIYEGRWHREGSAVETEPCLRCSCAGGALQCRRRTCAPAQPPPRKCHTLLRKNACCPEIHCPDGVSMTELGATSRLELDDYSDLAINSAMHGCFENRTLFASGSAMGSRTACEQCFCLRGSRRCVRPRCLPPPPRCRPQAAPGACCPTRYHCEYNSVATTPAENRQRDCFVEGRWIKEGEQVVRPEDTAKCTQCFCLRGAVHCQPLACAPALMGCRPLLRPGHCCPHQYECPHPQEKPLVTANPQNLLYITDNLLSSKNENRAFDTSKLPEVQTQASVSYTTDVTTTKIQPSSSQPKNSSSTNKVKRKTSDSKAEATTSHTPITNKPTNLPPTAKTSRSTQKQTIILQSNINEEMIEQSTLQPDNTVKIMINGTINCTAELSSSAEALNITNTIKDMDKLINFEARIPNKNIDRMDVEDHTFDPNEIITDKSVEAGFDDNDMFTINVTSSLRANTSHPTSIPGSVISISGPGMLNVSKKTKEDYDYDYSEATLPPSLPNLKIIPFVAADAVVEAKESPGVDLPYPIIERQDKFPVYYPHVDNKEIVYADRRGDVFNPTQYPVFTDEKQHLTKNNFDKNNQYTNKNNGLDAALQDFVISTSIGSHLVEIAKGSHKDVTKNPHTTKFTIEAPTVNLFSPPVETEGGFIPKGPGIVGEYYAVYPSTSAPVPHLTTSMQLDTTKEELEEPCTTSDGIQVLEGESIDVGCSVCACAWGELQCTPRACLVPPGCRRLPLQRDSKDGCCGSLVCGDNKSTTEKPMSPSKTTVDLNENITEIKNKIRAEIVTTPTPTTLKITTNSLNLSTKHPVVPPVDIINNTRVAENKNTSIMPPVTIKYMPSVITEKTEIYTQATTEVFQDISSEHNQSESAESASQEYEDEEEEDDTFSFGNVLKLLLSDNYDVTTTSPVKSNPTEAIKRYDTFETKPPFSTTTKATTTTTTTTHKPIVTTKKVIMKPTLKPFMPLPNIYPPSKRIPSKNVNSIDHLVLGELTSIKKTTSRPYSTSSRPFIASRRPFTTTSRPPEVYNVENNFVRSTMRPPNVGPQLLKLAGCNIYGKMYVVGRIIEELSSACLECRCTEVGVNCRALNC